MSSTSSAQYTLYHATLVHTPKLGQIEILPDSLVGVESGGKIAYLDSFGPAKKDIHGSACAYFRTIANHDFTFVDYSGSTCTFLFPGFIDTHIHASQYPNVGIGSELPLLEWLKDYTFALESKFCGNQQDRLRFAREIYSKVIDKTLTNGTTCASYFTTVDTETTKVFADLLAQKGQRGMVGKVCMDYNQPFPSYAEPAAECLAGMHELIDHCEKINDNGQPQGALPMVKPIVTPRFAPVCLRDLMAQLGLLSREKGLPVQTHISENIDEIKLVREIFPECANYTSVYDTHGLLGPSTILAHAVYLDDQERQIIKQKQCSISHCPTSNSFITSGEAPVREYLYEDQINVSLGTDLSGGYEQSILGVAKNLVMVSHHLTMGSEKDHKLSVADALYMATMGGAKACNLELSLGSFAKGKYFDAQLIDVHSVNSNIDVFDFQTPVLGEEDYEKKMVLLVHRWLFSGDDRNCVKVWCNGKLVVDKADPWIYI
ncbi:Metallo-dependent hydrolase [Metschnikowia bicuspidata var. bicuspidata NRRL YB-4993]|uniref:Probable guanine deaminase n=1 Tax=Metschnikowia bicuspidata var. bicuspidata NRRL YB-4993 TaxID=869754 RepID=A0A1A0HG56_9ASCO|nr:Metallo-dependent hydrolase [Metschnikowia bicuspidata var. bicuspidata NRRL YB-4993]OBA22970.1 Metallo-dependent hydrolase [Metschnikowia bicuspidata var. bicuspidata NRRL YB-4993]